MANIFHCFPINAPIDKVFDTISTHNGLDKWWTKTSLGEAAIGERFFLNFEPDDHWTAIVSKNIPEKEFELIIQDANDDWKDSKVGFCLKKKQNLTEVQFYHIDWKEENKHFRISNYCWAMYLRLLKRNLEFGEFVQYADRLNV